MASKPAERERGEANWSAGGPVPAAADAAPAEEPDLARENARLKAELAALKQSLAGGGEAEAEAGAAAPWPTVLDYDEQSVSPGELLAQLAGISKQRMKEGRIRNSSEFDYLPKPTADEAQLEADFIRWGYCLVADAMSPAQVSGYIARVEDQARAEMVARDPSEVNDNLLGTTGGAAAASLAPDERPWGFNALVNNALCKGQIFRDLVEFSEAGAQRGPLIDKLLTKVMGKGFGIGCAHGSIVGQGGGLQEIHIDQGGIPLPYPPWPMGSLIIWMASEFSLECGGTYVVPGSHRYASGANTFSIGTDLLSLMDREEHGLVAVCAPPGTCMLTDTRMLHCGGRRTAPGCRYAMRVHYNRGFIRPLHEQSSQNLHIPDHIYEQHFTPRLKAMMGVEQYNKGQLLDGTEDVPLGELSMATLGSGLPPPAATTNARL